MNGIYKCNKTGEKEAKKHACICETSISKIVLEESGTKMSLENSSRKTYWIYNIDSCIITQKDPIKRFDVMVSDKKQTKFLCVELKGINIEDALQQFKESISTVFSKLGLTLDKSKCVFIIVFSGSGNFPPMTKIQNFRRSYGTVKTFKSGTTLSLDTFFQSS